jgi:hypothetical protein
MTAFELVSYGAPTLAGIKTASMFTTPCTNVSVLMEEMKAFNRRFAARGLRIIPLRMQKDRMLIYLFRSEMLKQDIAQQGALSILKERGYTACSAEQCLGELVRHLRSDEEFPHEIGLFLGYPPEDVYGFIHHRDKACKCVGEWRVYGDEAAARDRFESYTRCRNVYCRNLSVGYTIEDLAVADKKRN